MTNESEKRAELNTAIREFRSKRGGAATHGLLEKLAGVTSVSNIPDDKIGAVLDGVKSAAKGSATRHSSGEINVSSIYDRWNNPPKRNPKDHRDGA